MGGLINKYQMKTPIITLALMLVCIYSFSQNAGKYGGYMNARPIETDLSYLYIPNQNQKEWSKAVALFRGKQFLFESVLGGQSKVIQFNLDPLAAAKSDELTTLVYRCDDLNKSGLILGFFGNYINENGVNYDGYGFKHLSKEKAEQFLEKIQLAMDNNSDFLKDDYDNNNIYFQFDDITVLIYKKVDYVIRLFWRGFDSTWENSAYQRSKRRFGRKISK